MRVYATDFAAPVVERLRYELGSSNHYEVFGRLVRFWTSVARERPNGVLDGLYAAGVARMAGWTGEAAFFLEAMQRAGVLCSPSADPHHHGRCTARAGNREGQPRRGHPPAELAVHQWNLRAGPAFRAQVRDARPRQQRFLLRPPPRGARAGYETAPRGATPSASLSDAAAPRGVSAESAAPRGDPAFTPQGGNGSPMKHGRRDPGSRGAPRGAGWGSVASAPRGGTPPASLREPPAPRGVKRRPKPHPRPGEDETYVSSEARRRGGAGSRPQPAAASPGRGDASAARRGRDPSPRVPTTEERALRAFAHRHQVEGRVVLAAQVLRAAYRARKCPSGEHGGESPSSCFLEAWNEVTGAGPQGPGSPKGGGA